MEPFHVISRADGYMGYPTVCLERPGQKLGHGDIKDPHRKGASTPLHTALNHSPVTREETRDLLHAATYRYYGRKMHNLCKAWQDNRNIGAK